MANKSLLYGRFVFSPQFIQTLCNSTNSWARWRQGDVIPCQLGEKFHEIHLNQWPSMVLHTFQVIYTGDWDWEDHDTRPSQVKRSWAAHLKEQKLCVVAHTWHPNKERSLKQEDHRPSWTGLKVKPYLKNSQGEKGLGFGSSNRVSF
jgi:hypothetical protein